MAYKAAIDLESFEEIGQENLIIQTSVTDIVKELDSLIDVEQEAINLENSFVEESKLDEIEFN